MPAGTQGVEFFFSSRRRHTRWTGDWNSDVCSSDLLHLASIGAHAPKINATVSALRFFFTVTLDRPELAKHLSFMHEPRKVPVVLSPEEVARFLEAAPSVKYKAALSVAYGAGLRVSEVVALKVSDIDSKRMMLRVEQGKGRKDRHAMLSPVLLELLRDWYRIGRPQGWLFPGLKPASPDDTPTHARLPRCGPYGRDHQAGDAAHLAPQLCDPSARAEHRYSGDSGPAGSRQRRKWSAYSITLCAAVSRVGGTMSPSALAVLRLTTSSKLVGCWIGKSAGFAPLRIFPT